MQDLVVRACDILTKSGGIDFQELKQLDDPRKRRRRLPGGKASWEGVAELLLEDRKTFNSALAGHGLSAQSRTAMKRHLVEAIGPIRHLYGDDALEANPFPEAWPLVANELSRRLRAAHSQGMAETELLNSLLLIGLLWTCRLPHAVQVGNVLEDAASKPLGLRGLLFRIPERLSLLGVADNPIALSQFAPALPFKHRTLSVLQHVVDHECGEIPNGKGFVQRMAKALFPVIPDDSSGHLDASTLGKGRIAICSLYEHTLLAYLTIACVEQLLRSWASSQHIAHIKGNGQPAGVMQWYASLNCSQQLKDHICELFDPAGANVRNRLMHGNLLEIESKSSEAILASIRATGLKPGSYSADPYSPENIARICLNCLSELDTEIANRGLSMSLNLSWAASLAPSASDIDFGCRLEPDLIRYDPDEWSQRMGETLDKYVPGLRQLFMLGVVGWIQTASDPSSDPTVIDSIPRLLCTGMVFETTYRLAAHLLGESVLQVGSENGTTNLHIQYKMLDDRPRGISTTAIQHQLVSQVASAERQVALQCLGLAIKWRNTLSHGAIVANDQRQWNAMGNVLIKSAQMLINRMIWQLAQP
jgi:hypothetical protein